MSATLVGMTLARADRFWAKVQKGDCCWNWTGGTIKKDGRGVFSIGPRSVTAPRAAWMIAYKQDIPEGRFVCHSCDNPNCVRPDHLWIGTNQQNIIDASLKNRLAGQERDACIHGHPLSGENLVIHKGRRACRTCYAEWRRNYKKRQRAIRRAARVGA